MTRLGRFLAMPWRERLLLIGVLLLVAVVRLALWVLPLAQIRRLASQPTRESRTLCSLSPDFLAWSVRVAARFVPGATCLTQGLSLKWLLALAGHSAQLRIGVAKGTGGSLDSHAWVVCNGRIMIGEHADLERYAQILVMGIEP